jgi:hypothetical protein
MGAIDSYSHYRRGRFPLMPHGATLTLLPDFRYEATVAHVLTNHLWSTAGVLRRPHRDDDPLDAIRGIMMATLLSLITFWMPLAIALTR